MKAFFSIAVVLLCLLSSKSVGQTVQLVSNQKFTVSCAQPDEVEPQRKIKIKFELMIQASDAKKDTIYIIEIGANPTVSQPSLKNDTLKFTSSEFPKANNKSVIVEKEVILKFTTKMIDKDEKVYLFIKNKPGLGVVELNVSCDKKKVVEPATGKADEVKIETIPLPVLAKGVTGTTATATVAVIKIDESPANKSKPFCDCISIANDKEVSVVPLFKTATNNTETADRKVDFKITLKRGCTIPSDTLVKIKLVTVGTSQSEPELTAVYFPVKKKDWPEEGNEVATLSFTTYIRLKNIDSLDEDKIYYLVIDNCSEPEQKKVVRESLKNSFNPNKPFWVEVGSNFDLLNEIKPNNVFYGIFMYKRDIRAIKFSKDKKEPNLSLFGGVYNSKSISEESSASFSPLVYFDPNKSLRPVDTTFGNRNTFWAFADSGKVKATTSVTNVGLFFSPQIRLTRGNANKDGLHVFASIWTEVIWQKFNTAYDFSGMKLYDSFKVVNRSDSFRAVQSRPADESQDLRSHYFGIGFPIYFKENELNLYFSPIIGITNQRLAAKATIKEISPFRNPFVSTIPSVGPKPLELIKNVLEVTQNRWKPFYLFQFRLNEENYGIAFTGEIRGLLLLDSKPVISFALSKKFDLNKLLTFGLSKP